MIGNEPYWHEAQAASKLDTFADPNLIVNVNENMDINSGNKDMVITGVDPHQEGVVEDVIQEWDEVAKHINGNDVIEHTFIFQELIGQPELADVNQLVQDLIGEPAVAGEMDEVEKLQGEAVPQMAVVQPTVLENGHVILPSRNMSRLS